MDLHVLQFQDETFDSAYGVFAEFTGGLPKSRVMVLTNRAIYLLSGVRWGHYKPFYCFKYYHTTLPLKKKDALLNG